MGHQAELCCIESARAENSFGSSMASPLEKSLAEAGWAWSLELLQAVVADLHNVGIKDAPHMVGERAARHLSRNVMRMCYLSCKESGSRIFPNRSNGLKI